jgi:Skp family chaperone for outer membrane proteins
MIISLAVGSNGQSVETATPPSVRIGAIDLERIDRWDSPILEFREAYRILKEEDEPQAKVLDAKFNEYQRLLQGYEKNINDPRCRLVECDAFGHELARVQLAGLDLQFFNDSRWKQIKAREAVLIKEVMEKLRPTMKTFAQDHNFDLLVDLKTIKNAMLVPAPHVDITDEFIEFCKSNSH